MRHLLSKETSPATSTMGDEEEDYGDLIYRERQLRKAEAVAVAAAEDDAKKKKETSLDVSSTRRRPTLTRATSAADGGSRSSSVNTSYIVV